MRFLSPFIVVALAANAPAQVLTATKLLSGSATDAATAVAASIPQGNVFLAGTTTSPDFPIVNGLVPRIPEAALRVSAGGKTFAPSSLTASQITAIAASSDGRTVLAANAASIYRSNDAGATWSAAPVIIPGSAVALAIDPVNASNAYALANLDGGTNFYRSADGGLTWQSSSPAGTQQQASTPRILIDPQNPASIYAYLGNGLNHSSDSGATWQRVTVPGSPVPGNPAVPVAFAIAPSQPQTLYTVTNFGLSEKSADGGATWQSTASLATTSANTMAVDPHNPDVIWFTDAHGIERSTDGGATVQNVAKIGDGAWQGIAIDPADSSHISSPRTPPSCTRRRSMAARLGRRTRTANSTACWRRRSRSTQPARYGPRSSWRSSTRPLNARRYSRHSWPPHPTKRQIALAVDPAGQSTDHGQRRNRPISQPRRTLLESANCGVQPSVALRASRSRCAPMAAHSSTRRF